MEGKSSETLYSDQKQSVTVQLCFAIFSATLGMFTFGYNIGVINAPQSIIEEFYNTSYSKREGSQISSETLNLLWSFTVSIFAIGGMIGGLLGGWWSDMFGRKRGMLLNTGFGILGAFLMGLAKEATSHEMVLIGRFIIGFNCGLYTGLSPIYNAEISPKHVRGAIGTINQLATTSGILFSQVLGLKNILGSADLWPLLLGLTGVPGMMQMLTMSLNPESPRYLLLVKNEEQKAVQALMHLRGTDDPGQVVEEIDEMKREKEIEKSEEQMSVWQILRASHLRMPLMLAVMMHLSQQFSGINTIFYYSTTLFKEIGLSSDDAQYATLGVGGILVTMTLVSVPLMDRAGRRTLHLGGLCGMFLFSIVFMISFRFSSEKDEKWLEILTITSALIIVVFFAIGPGSIPWLIVAELFTQGPRSAAVSIGALVNWLANFVGGQTFLPLQEALEELVFLPYIGLLIIFIIFLFIYLPETKNKSMEEISALFDKASKAGNENMSSSSCYATDNTAI